MLSNGRPAFGQRSGAQIAERPRIRRGLATKKSVAFSR
jgi:hypothetical protein